MDGVPYSTVGTLQSGMAGHTQIMIMVESYTNSVLQVNLVPDFYTVKEVFPSQTPRKPRNQSAGNA